MPWLEVSSSLMRFTHCHIATVCVFTGCNIILMYPATNHLHVIFETECSMWTQCTQASVNGRRSLNLKQHVRAQTNVQCGALGCLGTLCGALWCWGRTFNRWRQPAPRIVMFNYLCPIYTFVMGEKDEERGKWKRVGIHESKDIQETRRGCNSRKKCLF